MECDEAIEAVLAGDVEAYRHIVHQHHRPLYYFVLGKLSQESEASDIVQKTFVTAFDKLADFDRKQSFIVWLRGIALNYCRNEWRSIERQAKLRSQLLEAKRAALSLRALERDDPENEQRLAALRQCLAGLTESEQRVIKLRFVEDASLKLISEMLNKESEAVRHQLFRIRKRLKMCLQSRLALPEGQR